MKNTKRSLLTSVLSLLLCVSMLVGSTFAWFTDSVTSKNNIITSGNLDVVLEYKTNWEDEWTTVDETVSVFNDEALYEPGYTEVVFLRVKNAGSLALKYALNVNVLNEVGSVNVAGEQFKLSDYLQVGAYVQDEYSNGANYADTLMPFMFGSRENALKNVTLGKLESKVISADNVVLLPGDETAQVMALVLTMPTTVGNEANHKTGNPAPTVELGINLTATQAMHEEDSFGADYDKDAAYDEVGTTNLPKATVTALDATKVDGDGIVQVWDPITLQKVPGELIPVDVAYEFKANDTYEVAKVSEYGEWITDYVISFDKAIKEGSAALAGYYNNFGITDWISFKAPQDIEAGVEIHLLRDLLGQEIPYYAICRDVNTFECGATNLSDENIGTTMNVQLRLTNPDDATDYVVAGEFNYVFK